MKDLAPSRTGGDTTVRGPTDDEGTPSISGHIAAAWAIGGVALLFAWAAVRLGYRGISAIREGLTAGEWIALVALTAGFVYGEGLLALDRRWVPGMIERARHLRNSGTAVQRLLAPLHGLSLIGGDPRRMARAWLGTAGILAAVAVLRTVPQPWRGIVDVAVASALAWGVASILRRLPKALV